MGATTTGRSSLCALTILALALGTMARELPLGTERAADGYYNYKDVQYDEMNVFEGCLALHNQMIFSESQASTNNYLDKRVPLQKGKSVNSVPGAYYKNLDCVPYNFSLEDCTLCFCTDRPNLGLCWDEEPKRCAQTRKLIDEQKGLTNNNPQGVW